MTTVYFVRHAQSDASVKDSPKRPLTPRGLSDRAAVTRFLRDQGVDAVLSSPYARAVDTVMPFAREKGLTICKDDDFREWNSEGWIPQNDFFAVLARKWADLADAKNGESLQSLQKRNLRALNAALSRYEGKTIAIGTHGLALSALIRAYDPTYGFEDFRAMVDVMPWIVRMTFQGHLCAGMQKIDPLNPAPARYDGRCDVNLAPLGQLGAYVFVVIFARHAGKWAYCRAKTREGLESAGGHIEPGETPLMAAKRELYEETGATDFDIRPMFDYSVHLGTEYSNGQVFLADVRAFGALPPFEMAQVLFLDGCPDKMRFPRILPVLLEKIRAMEGL